MFYSALKHFVAPQPLKHIVVNGCCCKYVVFSFIHWSLRSRADVIVNEQPTRRRQCLMNVLFFFRNVVYNRNSRIFRSNQDIIIPYSFIYVFLKRCFLASLAKSRVYQQIAFHAFSYFLGNPKTRQGKVSILSTLCRAFFTPKKRNQRCGTLLIRL